MVDFEEERGPGNVYSEEERPLRTMRRSEEVRSPKDLG